MIKYITTKIKKIVEDKNLTYYIDTMGCSMNENDSSKYAGILESIGFKREENEEKANLIFLPSFYKKGRGSP